MMNHVMVNHGNSAEHCLQGRPARLREKKIRFAPETIDDGDKAVEMLFACQYLPLVQMSINARDESSISL